MEKKLISTNYKDIAYLSTPGNEQGKFRILWKWKLNFT